MSGLQRDSFTQLYSPLFPSAGLLCEVQFAYFLSGKNVGTLGLYLVTKSSMQRLWFEYGDVGRTWHSATISLHGGMSTSFRLMFRATADGREGGEQGEIGIDDVKFNKLCLVNSNPLPCEESQFRCTNGLCIDHSSLCDFTDDCGDGSDEQESECGQLDNRCNFEESYCGWSNVYGTDDFDWTPFSGRTISGWTGPVADHTKRTISGRYVYIEASSPRREADRAWLVSPLYGPASSHCSIRFYYHMYGTNIRALRLHLKSSDRLKIIFEAVGNLGDMWHRGEVTIPTEGDFQLVFEGVVGDGYQGDIALDDVSFSQHCGRKVSQTPVEIPRFDAKCDFETSFCGWMNAYSNPLPWTRNAGPTLSNNTGPWTDHTRGDIEGHYIYFEISGLRVGQASALKSPPIVSTPFNRVLSFWVFMYGQEVGCLEVQRKCGLESVSTTVWRLCGDQGSEWIPVSVDTMKWTEECRQFEISLIGTVGGKNTGDIAVDDVQFGRLRQSVSYPWPQRGCEFDRNLCDWTSHESESTLSLWQVKVTNDSLSFVTSAVEALSDGQSAVLESPIFEKAALLCSVTFRYRMHGENVGTLGLYSVMKSGNRRRWWFEYSDQGERWFTVSVTLTGGSDEPFKVYFNATNNGHGNGKNGWIDIDSVRFVGCDPASDVVIIPDVHEFSCQNGVTIGRSNLCDFVDDCGDTSDESLTWCSANRAACSFETGMCGWHNEDRHDDFDWTPFTGRTISGWTGPVADHTLADELLGRFLYIEASRPRKIGNKARLWSPRMAGSDVCMFRFFYHMYGDHIGSLSLILKQGESEAVLFTASGNQGDRWIHSEVDVSTNETYFLVFEGVVGGGYQGDIAIDSISFSEPCGMPEYSNPLLEPQTPAMADCTFEDGVCSWTNDFFNPLPWIVNAGPTPSRFTGPTVDHTSGAVDGHYIYFDITGLEVNQTSVLFSAPIKTDMFSSRLQFWLHMMGMATGCLSVEKQCIYGDEAITRTMWKKCGDQGDRWLHASVDISTIRCDVFRIRFVGSVGGKNEGDIAIDDIRFQPLSEVSQQYPMHWDGDWSVDSHMKWIGQVSLHHSPVFRRSSHNCSVKFDYSMRGLNVGMLGLHLSRRSGQTLRLWFEYGDLGDINKSATVRLNPGGIREDFILYFNVTENGHGEGRDGHVSINNITFIDCNPALDVVPVTCTADKFQCGNGYCIGSDRQCDFVNDCGDWSDESSDVCQGNNTGSCNFEKSFCSWTNVYVGDTFDWIPFSGRTPSGWTGPMADHTLQNETGRYLHIEASSPRKEGDTAQLRSPLLKAIPQTVDCRLRFFYHMYGKDIGTLKLLQTTNGGEEIEIFNATGDHGDIWLRESVSMTPSSQDFGLIFEASVGGGYQGDIALDDVSFSPGCPGIAHKHMDTSDTVYDKADCDFEYGFCGWENDYFNPLPWVRNQGKTLSKHTGPKTDFSVGTESGHYIYFEISGLREGEKSILRSPFVSTISEPYRYFTFHYHMMGNETGCLSVEFESDCLLETEKLWVACGDQGSLWHTGEVELPDCDVYRIVFEGTAGGGNRGDIALDDFRFTVSPVTCKLWGRNGGNSKQCRQRLN